MAAETWLITGGLGFIGVNLIERILDRPGFSEECGLKPGLLDRLTIRVLDSGVTAVTENLSSRLESRLEVLRGDIRDPACVERALEGVTRVIHLAAHAGVLPSTENPRYDFEVNSLGTFNLLDGARSRGISSFVFASSGAVVGKIVPPIRTSDALRPLSPYGASKAAGEAMIHAFRESYGLNATALRFGNIFGPKSQAKGSVVPLFIRKALIGEDLEVFGDGEQKRDFLYVGDLCEAIVRAVTQDQLKEPVYQLARGEGLSVNELLVHLKTALSAIPLPMPRVHYRSARPAEVLLSFYDLSASRRDLNWVARVSFEQGILETLNWYHSQESRRLKKGLERSL
jgi:UDP-glucose 4-epimerase